MMKKTIGRQHECVYCKQMLFRISVHIKQKHKAEKEVLEISNLSDEREKKIQLTRLGNKGDNLHNMKVVNKTCCFLI